MVVCLIVCLSLRFFIVSLSICLLVLFLVVTPSEYSPMQSCRVGIKSLTLSLEPHFLLQNDGRGSLRTLDRWLAVYGIIRLWTVINIKNRDYIEISLICLFVLCFCFSYSFFFISLYVWSLKLLSYPRFYIFHVIGYFCGPISKPQSKTLNKRWTVKCLASLSSYAW